MLHYFVSSLQVISKPTIMCDNPTVDEGTPVSLTIDYSKDKNDAVAQDGIVVKWKIPDNTWSSWLPLSCPSTGCSARTGKIFNAKDGVSRQAKVQITTAAGGVTTADCTVTVCTHSFFEGCLHAMQLTASYGSGIGPSSFRLCSDFSYPNAYARLLHICR